MPMITVWRWKDLDEDSMVEAMGAIEGLDRLGDLRHDDAALPQDVDPLDDHRQPHQRGEGDRDHHVASGQNHFPHGTGNLRV